MASLYSTESYDEGYQRIPVDAATSAFVTRAIMGTFDVSYGIGLGLDARNLSGYNNYEVTRVERLVNRKIASRYEICRRQMMDRAPFYKITQLVDRHNGPAPESEVLLYAQGVSELNNALIPQINEYYLLHGTKPEFVDSICQEGLKKPTTYSANDGLYGLGIYMTESVSKADQYTDDKYNRVLNGTPLTLILVRASLGNICLMNPLESNMEFITAPYMASVYNQYDSVLGLTNGKHRMLFREFIINDDAQCYPEYIVTYKRLPYIDHATSRMVLSSSISAH